jgi:hypothetical protein
MSYYINLCICIPSCINICIYYIYYDPAGDEDNTQEVVPIAAKDEVEIQEASHPAKVADEQVAEAVTDRCRARCT